MLTTLVGLLVAVGAALTHFYLGVVVGVAIAALFLPLYLPSTLRASIRDGHAAFKRQLPWRNPWVWFTFILTVAALGALLSARSGVGPRALIAGILGLVAAALSAGQAYRLRGPLTIAADSIAQAKYVIPLRAATVDVNESAPRSPAMVRITPAPGATTQLTSYTIDPWNYGLDVNTVASALSQLVRWLDTGRTTTPSELLAMLTVEPPEDLPLGSSAEVPVVVTNPIDGQSHAR